MGEVVGAALVAHVPTIVLPEAVRRELNEGQEISLVPGLRRIRAEALDRLEPDALVVFDTHWMTTFEHIVSAHARRVGKYTSEELPRGMCQVPYDYQGDPELARAIEAAGARYGTRVYACDDPYLPVHYPTINLLGYLHRGERVVSIGTVQTGEPDDFLALGRAVADAIAGLDRRVVLLASGGMSHEFWPMTQLAAHEASDPVHVRTPEARAADERRLAWMERGAHGDIIAAMADYARFSPEGRFGHYLMMIGALGGADCTATGQLYSAYESAAGTGQVHVWFERPAGGWS